MIIDPLTIIILIGIFLVLFIRHVGSKVNIENKKTNSKRVDNIETVTAVNVDTITLILKHVYKNASNEEKDELRELGKRYGGIDFEEVSKT